MKEKVKWDRYLTNRNKWYATFAYTLEIPYIIIWACRWECSCQYSTQETKYVMFHVCEGERKICVYVYIDQRIVWIDTSNWWEYVRSVVLAMFIWDSFSFRTLSLLMNMFFRFIFTIFSSTLLHFYFDKFVKSFVG